MSNNRSRAYIKVLLPKLDEDKIDKNTVDDNVFKQEELKEMIKKYNDSTIRIKDELTLFITLRKILPKDYENLMIDVEKSLDSIFLPMGSRSIRILSSDWNGCEMIRHKRTTKIPLLSATSLHDKELDIISIKNLILPDDKISINLTNKKILEEQWKNVINKKNIEEHYKKTKELFDSLCDSLE